MFNLKRAKKAWDTKNVTPSEKGLEKNRNEMEEVANDNPSTEGKALIEEHKGNTYVPTEGQFAKGSTEIPSITEKSLGNRKKIGDLYVPAINAFVEEIVQERRKDFVKLQKQKKDNWTLQPQTQNADLPKWPKSPEQTDAKTLPNDVDRTPNKEPLIGGIIVKSSVDNMAKAIKQGSTKSYDSKIVSILKNAQGRDLTEKEKTEINEIKKTRTMAYIKES